MRRHTSIPMKYVFFFSSLNWHHQWSVYNRLIYFTLEFFYRFILSELIWTNKSWKKVIPFRVSSGFWFDNNDRILCCDDIFCSLKLSSAIVVII